MAACPYFVEDPRALRGHWAERFPRRQPLHVELGCGKGVFTAELARRNPGVNFLAADMSPDVLGVARRNAENAFAAEGRRPENLLLAAFRVEGVAEILSAEDCVERLYLNFCNPWPRAKHHKKRLTHPNQLALYKGFLRPGAEIWFKTDDADLYLATQRYFAAAGFEILSQTADLYALGDPENIPTEHELLFASQGVPIKRIVARWPGGDAPAPVDRRLR